RKGRPRIGSKGIGFLAMARYCDRLWVESGAGRPFVTEARLPKTPATFDLAAHLAVPIPPPLLKPRLTCELKQARGRRLAEGDDYRWDRKGRLVVDGDLGEVVVGVRVDCSGLAFRAGLDFERLLAMADNADLEKLDDFASIDVCERAEVAAGTVITADR